jgi:outer membrane lipoprotein-sorting protein
MRRHAALGAVLLLQACATWKAVPPQLAADSAQELLQRVDAAKAKVGGYSAEMRFTYFGSEGRVRGTAIVVARRPHFLRYDIMGPHGGVLSAFATNGTELQLLNVSDSSFQYGPATSANMAKLLPLAPLHLGPAQWVGLLMGDPPIADHAQLRWDGYSGRYLLEWEEGPWSHGVAIDPQSNQITAMELSRPGEKAMRVELSDRLPSGLASRLQVEAPNVAAQIKIQLRDVVLEPDVDDDAFAIEPPKGAKLEYLGSSK